MSHKSMLERQRDGELQSFGPCEPCKGTGYWYVPRYPNFPYNCYRCQTTGTPQLGVSYAGIGSRETPEAIGKQMQFMASILATKGWILRSGDASPPVKAAPRTVSADREFATGCKLVGGRSVIRTSAPIDGPTATHAAMFHPAWDTLDEYAKGKHARNSNVMMGDLLDDPVKFVLCWTQGGAVTGGTGQALRIAAAYGIPVFNLWFRDHIDGFWKWING